MKLNLLVRVFIARNKEVWFDCFVPLWWHGLILRMSQNIGTDSTSCEKSVKCFVFGSCFNLFVPHCNVMVAATFQDFMRSVRLRIRNLSLYFGSSAKLGHATTQEQNNQSALFCFGPWKPFKKRFNFLSMKPKLWHTKKLFYRQRLFCSKNVGGQDSNNDSLFYE